MEDIRILFILAGALGIGALLVHGLWSLRRQRSGKLKEKSLTEIYKQQQSSPDKDGFDADGVGTVRVVAGGQPSTPRTEPTLGDEAEPNADEDDDAQQLDLTLDEPVVKPSSPVDEVETPVAEVVAPVVAEETPEQDEVEDEDVVQEEPEEVLVLSVQGRNNGVLSGAELLPNLLSLGLKFGEMGIFHRHQEPSGKGPVMFSLANMVNPGTFDVDNMEQFETPGITMFMTLPCAGNAQQAFNMMLNAAQKLAGESDALVLDDTRCVLTQQKIRHYQERIREFERKRLLVN